MSWFFYNKEGKLLYDVVSGAAGNAQTLDGIDSTGFVQIGAPGLNLGDVDIDGSLTLPVSSFAVDTLLSEANRTVLVDSSGGVVTITLPATPLTGQIYEIRDVGSTGAGDSSTNNIIVDPNSNNLDGSASNLTINEDGKGIVIVFDGAGWITLADRTISAAGALDADTLDGIDSADFLRSDIDDTAAGNITFSKSTYSPVATLNDTTNPNLLDDTYRTVVADTSFTSPTDVTITLPAAPVVGQWYEISDATGSASPTNRIIIDPNGNNIDGGSASVTLDTAYDCMVLVCTNLAGDWAVVAHRFPPSGGAPPVAFDDLTDATITTPADGELVRFSTTAGSEWVNVTGALIDDLGRLHLTSTAGAGGISLGDSAGAGLEVILRWAADNTLEIVGRTALAGTPNFVQRVLANGTVPTGNTYDVEIPFDNTLLCNTSAGDLRIRLANDLNTLWPPSDGDIITIKDVGGNVPLSDLALVAEGVGGRNVPLLQATSTVGGPTVTITTTTPGGIGVDEEQSYQVSGGTSFRVTFDGQEAATDLSTTTATGADLVTAINSLSPHLPKYGHFSVSTTTPAALVSVGVPITFDGGALIDGEADFYASVPYQSMKVTYNGGNWFLL